jgi:hypothetical protein
MELEEEESSAVGGRREKLGWGFIERGRESRGRRGVCHGHQWRSRSLNGGRNGRSKLQ